MKYCIVLATLALTVAAALHAQQATTKPADRMSESEKAGERLYLQRCALCHSGTAPAYETYGPPVDSEVVSMRGEPAVRQVIMEGSARMPGFKYTLDEQQVGRIVAFLKILKDPNWQ